MSSVSNSGQKPPRRLLCKDFSKGKCPLMGDECEHDHVECSKAGCRPQPAAGCLFGHPWAGGGSSSADSVSGSVVSGQSGRAPGDDGGDCDDNCSVASSITMESRSYVQSKPCMSGIKCFNFDCSYEHPDGWSACVDAENCIDFDCPALNHPYSRRRCCRLGSLCGYVACRFLHPEDWSPCPEEVACCEYSCSHTHPEGRATKCKQGICCPNLHCDDLHPDGWDPVEPTESAAPVAVSLKTQAQRDSDRQKASLPIFSQKEAICDRLQKEKVLVVTASTGSGKTTQIPQYCAERFGGLVVCTQPRVMAAISIAKRIAVEFDDSGAGQSVGYQVGGRGNKVNGSKIMMMTDAALVRMSQDDKMLSQVKVLIIDEAHERNLNTDIVLGLAKMLREKRADDFFVVIASATIDPTGFLSFFKSPYQALNVQGRIFEVSLDYKPPVAAMNPKQLIADHVIPSVVESMEKYADGHVLVFLPGQMEIDLAIKRFMATTDFTDVVVFPLFGALPPEEQDKIMKFDSTASGQRMVVFTTNVAETSLTIPGVTLVVDAGLAKEVRYDQTRRLSVVELVTISRSSADQRKGRAGRIAPGHCVRLYADEDMVRTNIEPEIVRASLDSVMLQLVQLGFNPYLFPFMTPPDTSALKMSLNTLLDVSCIQHHTNRRDTDKEFSTTKLGKLFAELPFDPRLSAFLVACYREFDRLKLGAIVASLLSAPGSVYFLGGSTKAAKDAAKQRVAVRASKFDSDLLCMASVFDGWQHIGSTDKSNMCNNCGKKCPRTKGCRQCRVKYSMSEGLNNKVLDFVALTAASVQDMVKKARLPSLQMREGDDLEAISYCLERYFTDQMGEVLVPEHPPDGVRLDKVGVRARITTSSSFLQKLRPDPFRSFVALSVMKVPSGEYFIDKLHPVTSRTHANNPACVVIFSRNGVGSQIFKQFRDWLRLQQSREEFYWLVPVFDVASSTLYVHNTANHRDKCCSEITEKLDSIFADKIGEEVTQTVGNGEFEAAYAGGLEVSSVSAVKDTFRIQLRGVPIKAVAEFRAWLVSFFGDKCLPKSAIRWAGAFPDDRREGFNGAVVVTSKDVADSVTKKGSAFIAADGSNRDALLSAKRHLFRITLKCTGSVTEADIQTLFAGAGVVNTKLLSNTVGSFPFMVRNMPVSYNEQWIRARLPVPVLPSKANAVISFAKGNVVGASTASLFITYTSAADKQVAMQALSRALGEADISTEVSYVNKKGNQVTQHKGPEILDREISLPSSTFRLDFRDIDSASTFVAQFGRGHMSSLRTPSGDQCTVSVTCHGEITIAHTDLYKDLPTIIARMAEKEQARGISLKTSKNKFEENSLVLKFSGPPDAINTAVVAAKAVFSSITLKGGTQKHKAFYQELHHSAAFSARLSELGLRVNWDAGSRGELHGPRLEQGEMMRNIADMFTGFEARYLTFTLSPSINNLFGPGTAGQAQFKALATEWKGRCVLKHDRFACAVTAHFIEKSSSDTMAGFKVSLNQLLLSIGGEEASSVKTCCFCGESSASTGTLGICGHAFCQQCFSDRIDDISQPLCCGACRTPVSVKDIRGAISQDRFVERCNQALLQALRRPGCKFPVQACPNSQCGGVLPKGAGLLECGQCCVSVCMDCGCVNTGTHTGRSCAEYAALLDAMKNVGGDLRTICADGEKFAREQWPANLAPISRVDVNPGIFAQCMASQRFSVAIEKGNDIRRGFFGWHGTSPSAIPLICEGGFDPSRRAGQAHGPGEYFGTDPAVSLGYARGSTCLILSYILGSASGDSNVKHVPGFCYVVNNPRDWSLAYCLPLLAVSFGANADPPFKGMVSAADVLGSSVDELGESFGVLSVDQVDSSSMPRVAYSAPYRWHWTDDRGDYQPYSDEINGLLESYHDNWKFKNGPSSVTTPEIVRYVDDRPQRYIVDFQKNIQANAATRFTRNILRKEVDLAKSASGHWFVKNYTNSWLRYESLVEGRIEQAFSLYRRDLGSSTTTVNFPGRPERYEIDFIAGTQRNTVTDTVRAVNRVVQGGLH